MGKVETALKDTVNRLAKKQAREMTQKFNKDIKQLKGRLTGLTKEVKKLQKQLESERLKQKVKRVTAKAADKDHVRLSAKQIKTLRKRLGISQKELAVLAGVSFAAVSHWEAGKTKPSEEKKAKVAGLRNLGKREVKKILSTAKKSEQGSEAPSREKKKKTQQKKATVKKTKQKNKKQGK